MSEMDKLSLYYSDSIAMKAEFAKLSTQQEKDALVATFIKKLRNQGLSKDEIESILNIELVTESQGNRVMISQTAAYKAALAKALGTTR